MFIPPRTADYRMPSNYGLKKPECTVVGNSDEGVDVVLCRLVMCENHCIFAGAGEKKH